jgi:hypothetical protein
MGRRREKGLGSEVGMGSGLLRERKRHTSTTENSDLTERDDKERPTERETNRAKTATRGRRRHEEEEQGEATSERAKRHRHAKQPDNTTKRGSERRRLKAQIEKEGARETQTEKQRQTQALKHRNTHMPHRRAARGKMTKKNRLCCRNGNTDSSCACCPKASAGRGTAVDGIGAQCP